MSDVVERLRELSDEYEVIERPVEIQDAIAEIERLQGLLADCFRESGADTDGNEDWRIAPSAPQEVAVLRKDYDECCEDAERLREALEEIRDRFPAEEWRGGNARCR